MCKYLINNQIIKGLLWPHLAYVVYLLLLSLVLNRKNEEFAMLHHIAVAVFLPVLTVRLGALVITAIMLHCFYASCHEKLIHEKGS